ncbi:MAG: hypothetical protein ACRD36_10470, partial [Candidatus Acidiferrum sp.]
DEGAAGFIADPAAGGGVDLAILIGAANVGDGFALMLTSRNATATKTKLTAMPPTSHTPA